MSARFCPESVALSCYAFQSFASHNLFSSFITCLENSFSEILDVQTEISHVIQSLIELKWKGSDPINELTVNFEQMTNVIMYFFFLYVSLLYDILFTKLFSNNYHILSRKNSLTVNCFPLDTDLNSYSM